MALYYVGLVAPVDYPALYAARCRMRALWGQELDRAKADCERALAGDPRNLSSLQSEGIIALRENRADEAWRYFDTTLDADPDNALSLYGRSIAAGKLGRADDARADLERANSRDNGETARIYASYGLSP